MDAFKRAHKGAPGCDCSDCRGTSRTKRARLKHADRQMLATIERYTDGESCRDCGAPCGYTRICTTCGRWAAGTCSSAGASVDTATATSAAVISSPSTVAAT